jgi:non-canonical purine NTP pyrophosphatase (RdgB/HAM1 family)
MKLIFVTGNKGKFAEAKLIIPELEQLDIDLMELQEIDPEAIIKHKLKEAAKTIQGNLVVEDTSLYLDCLNGLPGPLIKWFMKTIGNAGLVSISESFKNNRAVAKVIIGLGKVDGSVEFFEGLVSGKIVRPEGKNGFGWDPVFQPDGWNKTFAQMTPAEKNKISMRRIVFQKLKDYLTQ